MVRRALVAQPALVRRRAHLLLVTEALQILRRDARPLRGGRRGGRGFGGFGGHDAIVSALGEWRVYCSKAGSTVPESRISQMLALVMPSKLILFNVAREYVRSMAT